MSAKIGPFKAVAGFFLAMVLTLLSIPWVVIAMGYGFWNDKEKADWWMEHSPVVLWLDWLDRRNCE